MKVSVVIPTLNEEAHLPALLETLRAQSRPADEIIVVDAGSTDRTRAVAEAGGTHFLTGGGLPGFSRNLGAAHARGDWLLFLDADVRLPPSAIEEALSAAEIRGLDGLSSAFVPDGQRWLIRFQHRLSVEYFWLTSKIRWPHSIGAFLLVRRALHAEIGGFDETVRVAEDQDYVRRLGRVGRYAFTRQPVVEIADRRFESEGIWRMSAKWIGIEIHRLVQGEIRHDAFRYFG